MVTAAANLVAGIYPSIDHYLKNYSLPVRETSITIANRRNPMLSVIKIALLQFRDEGTKLSFVPNGLKFDNPGLFGDLSRTYSYYRHSGRNASAIHYNKLLEDFRQAYSWYHTIDAADALFKECVKGLKCLKKSYPDGDINDFVSKACSIIKGEELENHTRAETIVNQVDDARSEAEGVDDARSDTEGVDDAAPPLSEARAAIQQALRVELDRVIRELIDEDFINVVAGRFQRIKKTKPKADKRQIAGTINELVRGKCQELNQNLLETIQSAISVSSTTSGS